MPKAQIAGNVGEFRTAYEFRRWIMGDIKKQSKASEALNFNDETSRQFLNGLSDSIRDGVKKLIDSYEQREKKLEEQLKKLKQTREEKRDAVKKRQAIESKKESDDIANLIAVHEFEKQRKQFSKRAIAQYDLLRRFKPTQKQEKAYSIFFQKVSELTAFRTKKDITTKDIKAIKKLESDINKMSSLLGDNIKKKLDKIEKGTSEGEKKWFRTWSDYKDDLSLFKDKVLDGIKGIGRKLLRGFLNIGIGPLTIGNIAKLVLGSVGAAGWVTGATVTGLGALGSKLGVGKGASWLGRKAVGGVKAVGSQLAGAGGEKAFEQSEEGSASKIDGLFSRYILQTKNYRDKMLLNMKKHTQQLTLLRRMRGFGGNMIRMFLALIPTLLSGILGGKLIGGLIKGIGSKIMTGIVAALSGLALGGGKLLGSIGRILSRFLLSPAGLVIGAGVGGAALGTAIYKMFDTQILDGIEWVFEKFNEVVEFFKEKWESVKNIYQRGKEKVSEWLGQTRGDTAARTQQQSRQLPMSGLAGGPTLLGRLPTEVVEEAASLGIPVVDRAAAMVGRSQAGEEGLPAVGDVITKMGSNVNIKDLDPAVRRNLLKMAEAYKDATGKKLGVTSGKRSSEHQAILYKTMPEGMAARPGNSLHEYGYAVDVPRQQAEELAKLGMLGGQFGFVRPLAKGVSKPEPWHMTPPGASVAAIKAGMDVGDATNAMVAGNTSAVRETFSAPPAGMSDADLSGPGGEGTGGSKGSIMTDQKVGVAEIPNFSTVDQTLLAMNVGAFSGA